MGLLDKLKPLPRWKNADAAVRLEAVRELDDASALATLAETDPDAKVRRAAISRVDDVAVLARVAGGDSDDEARDKAADRLLGTALAADTPEAAALAAVRGISDPRKLSTIAKTAGSAVRAEALARVTDERALGGIARHAKDEGTARAALDRLTEADEVLNVALNGDHKDVALAALDRAIAPNPSDTEVLKAIEARSQQKAVSKRARALLQEIEAAEAARRAAEEARLRDLAVRCELVEHLAQDADWTRAEIDLSRAVDAWRALDDTGEFAARFDRAVDSVRESIATRRRDAEEAAERARARAEALATRDALCVRVETLDGDDTLEQLAAIEEEWRSLLPLVGDGPEADRLAERFAEAAAACRKRYALVAVLAETRAALEARVVEAEALPSTEEATVALARWHAIGREARGLAATLEDGGRPAPDLVLRLDAVQAIFDAREREKQEAAAKLLTDFTVRLQRLVDRAKRAVEADAITLREGERLMRDIRQGMDELPRFADHKDSTELASTLRTLQEQVAPRVRELREMDDWRRFANAQAQETLIIQTETLLATLAKDDQEGRPSDLAGAARTLRTLHTKWKDAAEAPRDQAQRLWERFRTATDLIRLRCEPYFAKLREERTANAQRRQALVEEAETLAASKDWNRSAVRFQALQTEWNASGPAGGDEARDLSRRFRAAANQFFLHRREEVTARKKTWAENLEKKEAMCARAEALAESTEWESASAEIKRLQAEWKTVGPVRRSKSEEIWARFRGAADKFFERYHNRHQIALAGKLAEREAMVVELESLVAADPAPDGLLEKVQQIRATWNRSVPIPSNELRAMADRWQAALVAVANKYPEAVRGTDLDPVAIRQRMEKLVAKVEMLLAGQTEAAPQSTSQTELLAQRLRSAFASNAMGGRSNEELKWRAAADIVKDAQTSWQRLPPVVGEAGHALEARFNDACRRVFDHARRFTTAKRPGRPAAAAV